MLQDHRASGFTLIELLIASALFVVLIGTLGGTYITFIRQHRSELQRQALQQDLNTFFEVLDREVRTAYGSTFRVTSSGRELSLRNQNLECVKYGLGSGAQSTRLLRVASSRTGCDPTALNLGNGSPVTSPNTELRRLFFTGLRTTTVSGPLLTGSQGRLSVSVRGCPKNRPDAECVDVQTTMTSRQYAPPP